MLILSVIALSIRTKPIRNWFSNDSPTERTLLFPRWSISSIDPFPVRRPRRYLTTATISSLVSTLVDSGISRFNFSFSFNRPTPAKSYRFLSKKRLLKRFFAISIVGGSPGRNLLYITRSASS